MQDLAVALVERLRQGQPFETMARDVLGQMLGVAQRQFASDTKTLNPVVLRGVVHLRPSQGYLGLVIVDANKAQTKESPSPKYMPSATVWRRVELDAAAIGVDVMLGTISPLGHQGATSATWSDDAIPSAFDSPKSLEGFKSRNATHVLVFPLLSTTSAVVGLVALELHCPAAIGAMSPWSSGHEVLQLCADVATPYFLTAPTEQANSLPTDPSLPVIGQAMGPSIRLLRAFARQSETLMLCGPTGVGKSRLAKWCHATSPRSAAAFEVVDLLAVPDEMQMAELFGWQKGAFTGAVRDQLGSVTRANGGTLFIDEIDKLSLKAQAGLLTLLEERTYRPLGSTGKALPADVRFIVATNANLRDAIDEGTFREDLYYRINVLPVQIPPLDKRRDEIARWAEFYVHRQAQETALSKTVILAVDGVAMLVGQQWPGNLRQLDNVIRRAFAIAHAELSPHDASLTIAGEHIEAALAFESPPPGAKADLFSTMMHAAANFAAEAERLARCGETLDLDRSDVFRAMVVVAAAERFTSVEEVFRSMGKAKVVTSRNSQRDMKRAIQRVADFREAMGRQGISNGPT